MREISEVKALLSAVSLSSADPDTQTACVVFRGNWLVAAAANEMPIGVHRTAERITRPGKYRFVGHAERTLIARAARSGIALIGCEMYLNWFPCADCALAIAEAGIKTLFADREKYDSRITDDRYGFAEAEVILSESGVAVEWM